jgi:hypothetical protein
MANWAIIPPRPVANVAAIDLRSMQNEPRLGRLAARVALPQDLPQQLQDNRAVWLIPARCRRMAPPPWPRITSAERNIASFLIARQAVLRLPEKWQRRISLCRPSGDCRSDLSFPRSFAVPQLHRLDPPVSPCYHHQTIVVVTLRRLRSQAALCSLRDRTTSSSISRCGSPPPRFREGLQKHFGL